MIIERKQKMPHHQLLVFLLFWGQTFQKCRITFLLCNLQPRESEKLHAGNPSYGDFIKWRNVSFFLPGGIPRKARENSFLP